MVKIFNDDIIKVFTGGESVKAIYSEGVKVWPTTVIKTGEWVEVPELSNPGVEWGRYIWYADNEVYYSDSLRQYHLLPWREWEESHKSFEPYSGGNVWYKDNEVYYSDNTNQKKWEWGEWVDKHWDGISFDWGQYIWHDNDGHTYYSELDEQYELIGNKWYEKHWNRYLSSGEHIWHDNEGHTYYSYYDDQYELINGEWVKKHWDGENWDGWTELRANDGYDVWEYDGQIYCSEGSRQLVLVNGKWKKTTWSFPENEDLSAVWGHGIWKYENDVYFTWYGRTYRLVINN